MQKDLLECFTNDSKFKIEKINLNSNIKNTDEDTILNNFLLVPPVINLSKNGEVIFLNIFSFLNSENYLFYE